MKEKLLIFAVALLMVAFVPGVSFSQGQALSNAGFAAKVGLDLSGEADSEVRASGIGSESFTDDMDMGFSLAAEYLFPLGFANVGPGLAFLIPRGADEEGATGKVGFLPIYAVVNVPIPVQGSILPYIFGRVGYSILTDDSGIVDGFEALDPAVTDVKSEGGIYWGIGAGILFAQNILVELCYASHHVESTADYLGADVEGEADYTYINLSVGYKF